MEQKAKDLLLKLKKLSEKGVGGEKINAEQMLEKMLTKHGITLDDLEKEEILTRKFPIPKHKHHIFIQVALKIMGKSARIYGSNEIEDALFVDCKLSEALDIDSTFEFYWRVYEEELKLFNKAFIYKNDLIPFDAEAPDPNQKPTESAEEIKRMREYFKNINKSKMHKQLDDGLNKLKE